MAAAGSNLSAEDIKIYQAAVISTKDESNIEGALLAANLIKDVTDFSLPVATRGSRDKNVFGSDVTTPLPGKISYGEATLTVVFDPSDTKHVALRDNDKETTITFLVDYIDGSNNTYAAFDGFVTAVAPGTADDELNTLEITIQANSDVTWVDNS